MQLKIGVITAHAEAEERYNHLAGKADCRFIFRTGSMSRALECARELQNEQDVDAIITIGVRTEIIDGSIRVPVFPVSIGNFDLLNAIHEAGKLGERIAFTEIPFQKVMYDLDKVAEIAKTELHRYGFTFVNSTPDIIRQVKADGCDVVITEGGYSYDCAKKLGMSAVLITPEERSFNIVLDDILDYFNTRKVEQERTRWLMAVLDNMAEGIIVTDREGRIVTINATARNFMRLTQEEIVGKHALEIESANPLYYEFMSTTEPMELIKGEHLVYVVRKSSVFHGDELLGYMHTAIRMSELQKLEMKTRKKASEQGFVAKNVFDDIIGKSPAIKSAIRQAKLFAASDANILLGGESGSGKEIFAQSIHNASRCAAGPFVAINCTVLTDTLLESELFGYEEGAFTGAVRGGMPGLFEMAHGGTLFLDEIGDMPLRLQAKLLRVLQEKTVRRIGGSRNIPVNVRLITATNKSLALEVEEERFRKDLLYRINVLELAIPPLRERQKDIPLIARHFARLHSEHSGRYLELSAGHIERLESYSWPGNVRELSNIIERACIVGADFALAGLTATGVDRAEKGDSPASGEQPLMLQPDTMHNMENEIIRLLYLRNNGNRKAVEQTLDISASTLHRRMKEIKF